MEAKLTHIEKSYVAHEICGTFRGDSHHKLMIEPIFDNIKVRHRDKQFQLLLRKGVYPYEYMDDQEKFEKINSPPPPPPPPIEAFYSELNLSGISECDYDHAQRVWTAFGMKNLGDYHDFYLKMDVLLLSNVSETFRTTYLEHYSLNLAHFYTSLRLA